MTEPGTRDPDALRRRAGVRGDPGRDQHFLVDDRVLDRLPGYLPDDADLEHVLEVGGGTGALTDRLLVAADRVTVVERDPALADFLREEFAGDVAEDRLSVLEGDALEVALPPFSASVSNLPYGVASGTLFRLLPARRPLVVMVQREFAERMAAEPGTPAYGRLSVTAGHYADVEVVEPVPPEAFDPRPAVESAVVRTRPRVPGYAVDGEARTPTAEGQAGGETTREGRAAGDGPPTEGDDPFFLRFVTAVFTQRRKTMRNAIRNTAHISGLGDPEAVVEAADDALMDRRAGDLAPAEFAALARLARNRGDPS